MAVIRNGRLERMSIEIGDDDKADGVEINLTEKKARIRKDCNCSEQQASANLTNYRFVQV